MERYKGIFHIGPRYLADFEMERLYLDQDNIVAIKRLREDVLGGTFLTTATASMVLFTVSGVTVSGASFPISLDYQTGSPGFYEGHLPGESLSLVEGTQYDLNVDVVDSGAQVASWTRRLVATYRR